MVKCLLGNLKESSQKESRESTLMLRNLFPEKPAYRFCPFASQHLHQDDQDSIRLDNIKVHYRHRIAIEGISGCFKKGSLTAIIGPNGGGKSTLLKCIMGMVPLTSGRVSFSQAIGGTLAYLPQQSDIDRSFPLTVQDVVASGHCQHHGFFKRFDQPLLAQVATALEEVGMVDCMDRSLSSLSGGQFQRVLFARIALQNADCILLDEPFTAIDSYTIADLIKLLERWNKAGKTLLVVNHDIDLVQDYFPETLLIARHNLGWGRTADIVTLDNLRHAKHIARQLEAFPAQGETGDM
jgi:zinc/manganese transport system ATP-binding protein